MATEVVVPEVGEGGIEVTLARWIAHEGDSVKAGDILFELDTQKAVLEVEAVSDGILTGIRVAEGASVEARQVVALLSRPGEDELATPAPAPQRAAKIAASPKARQVAAARGIDLATVKGSGPDGLITERDLEAAVPQTERSAGDRTQDAVARRTADAWRTVPHFALTLRADVTEGLRAMRPTTLVAHALVRALREHPECVLGWEGGHPVRRDAIHLGILVDTPHGLLLPRVADAGGMTATQLETAISDAVARAQSGRLQSQDGGERTATVSNLGMFSVDAFAGVIAAPDVMLLAIGRARPQAVARDGTWTERRVVELTLSIDHRALNGADGARLLTTLERILSSGEVER